MQTVSVATTSQIKEGELLAVKAGNQKVLLTKIDDKIYAVENRCPHLGMPLTKGKVCNRAVTCRWHGASFDLTTGENVKWVDSFVGIPLPEWSRQVLSAGKSAQSIKTYPVTVRDDEVSIGL